MDIVPQAFVLYSLCLLFNEYKSKTAMKTLIHNDIQKKKTSKMENFVFIYVFFFPSSTLWNKYLTNACQHGPQPSTWLHDGPTCRKAQSKYLFSLRHICTKVFYYTPDTYLETFVTNSILDSCHHTYCVIYVIFFQ